MVKPINWGGGGGKGKKKKKIFKKGVSSRKTLDKQKIRVLFNPE